MKECLFALLAGVALGSRAADGGPSPEGVFREPPPSARVGVWWHWMGAQVTKDGIVRDLDWMAEMGINSATVFAMADSTTPWAKRIANIPTDIGHPYSEAWWDCFRFACAEGRRRGIGIGIHNCPGYTSTGGKWIPPRLSMRELVFNVEKPEDVSTEPNALYPVYNEDRRVFEKPACPARRTDIEAIATVRGVRVSHVPMGAYVQPCDWGDFGLECDKMNPEAVRLHLDTVFAELHRHLGPDLRQAGLTHMLLDSYEAGTPTWTPNMPAEFKARRGYDPIPYLPVLGGFTNGYGTAEIETFRADFDRTVKDLYRDVLFKEMYRRVRAEGLDFSCEPYEGPFVPAEVAPYIDRLMTEFWYDRTGRLKGFDKRDWRLFAGPDGRPHGVLEAEAFTGNPQECPFTETPLELKRTGDSAFLAGVNRFILHSVVHQPWGDDVRPGVTMGRWGTHFGRNQVWGEAGTRWFRYVARCQALLQWGEPSDARLDVRCDQIARTGGGRSLHFLVNRSDADVPLTAAGRWLDPVSGRVSRPPDALKPTQSGFLLAGAEAEGEPAPYSADLFVPPTTWAKLLQEDERYPADVAFAPAPLGCGEMMLSYPDWFRKGMGARPTPRKWFATWRYPAGKEASAAAAGLAAFRDARFGMFIHWGLYSLLGGRWQGQTMDYIGEWIQSRYRIPSAEYAKLAEQFNPVAFDADAWAQSAADAGMSYVVLTTKHHEGFALFASKASPFNVVDATPFARDVFAELAAACRRHGLKVCLYYSQCLDWHELDAADDVASRGSNFGMDWGNAWDWPDASKKDVTRYLRNKVYPQLKELLTNYGEIFYIWFDCPFVLTREQTSELREYVRSLQPQTLVNSRIGHGLGDFDTFGDNQMVADRASLPGEVAMTLNDTWGFKWDDHNWKSGYQVACDLAQTISCDANLLLNIGPRGDGRFPDVSRDVLRELGEWRRRTGFAIRGAGPNPFPQAFAWGWCTQAPGNVLQLVLRKDWTNDLELCGLRSRVLSGTAPFRQEGMRLIVKVQPVTDAMPRVVRLVLEGRPSVDETLMPQNGRLILMPTLGRVLPAARPQTGEPVSLGAAGERLGADVCRVTARGALTAWHHPGDAIAWNVRIPEEGRYRVSVWTESWAHSRPWAGDRRVRVEMGPCSVEADLVKSQELPHTAYDSAISDVGECVLAAGEGTVRVSTVLAGSEARFFDLTRVVLTRLPRSEPQPSPKAQAVGVALRYDDNHKAEEWRALARQFEERGLRMSLAVVPNARHGMTPAHWRTLKELSDRGHEIMDHTPQHALYRLDYETREAYQAAKARNYPFVAECDDGGMRLYCLGKVDLGHPANRRFRASARGRDNACAFTVSDAKDEGLVKWTNKVYIPSQKRFFGVDREGGRLILRDFWRRGVALDVTDEEMVLVSDNAFEMPEELLRLQTERSRKAFTDHGLPPPRTWCQPGGWEPFVPAQDVARICGREFGYNGGTCVPGSVKRSFAYDDPNGAITRFAIRPCWKYFDDGSSPEAIAKEIREVLADGRVALVLSHMSPHRVGGWESWLRLNGEFLDWLKRERIPVRTPAEWSDIVYGKMARPHAEGGL